MNPRRAAALAAAAGSDAAAEQTPGRRRAKRVAGMSLVCGLALTATPGTLPLSVAATTATETAGGSSPTTRDEVFRLLAARREGRVSFTEVHTLAVLDRPLESSGELLYEAPDHLEKRTLKPKPETLILEHGVLTAQRGHRTRVMSLRDFPQIVPFVESIRATLAGDAQALERFFTLNFSGTPQSWSLVLVPRDVTLTHVVKEIRIEGERDALHTVRITQADGDASVMTIGGAVGP